MKHHVLAILMPKLAISAARTVLVSLVGCFFIVLSYCSGDGMRVLAQNARPPEREYIIGVGDTLDIQVWKNNVFTRKVTVLPGGTITMPLLGDIQAANLPKSTFEKDLQKQLEAYLKEPLITITLTPAKEIRITFSGVLAQETYIPRGTSLLQVLQDRLPTLTPIQPPPDLTGISVVGSDGTFSIDGTGLLSGKAPEANIKLEWGDDIHIPSTIPPTPAPVAAETADPRALPQSITLSNQEFESLLQQFPEASELLQSLAVRSDENSYNLDLSQLSDTQQAQLGAELLQQLQQQSALQSEELASFSDITLMGIGINLAYTQYLAAFLAIPNDDPEQLPLIQRFQIGDLVQKGATDTEDVFLHEILASEKSVLLRQGESYQELSLITPISQVKLSGILNSGRTPKAFFSNITPSQSRLITKRRGFKEGDTIDSGVTLQKISNEWVLLGDGQTHQLVLLRDPEKHPDPPVKPPTTQQPIATATPKVNSSESVITVWYGSSQVFGNNGIPQRWINILGHVSSQSEITALTYSLNQSEERPLSLGPVFRLEKTGDFNVEIAYEDLLPGPNQVVITATDAQEKQYQETVSVEYVSGQVWQLPYVINWSQVKNIQDVAQVVDGHWELEGDSVRSIETGYDRLIAIGDTSWTDYEATVSFVVNSISTGTGKPAAIGMALRWDGHHADGHQPSVKWFPIGGLGWHRFYSPGRLQIDGGASDLLREKDNPSFETGVSYMLKMRVETIPEGARYSLKFWQTDTPEPQEWDLIGDEGSQDPQQGALLLLAHHVDANFGNISIQPLSKP